MPLRGIPESGSGVGPLVWIGTEEEMSIGVALITSEARARLARGPTRVRSHWDSLLTR